MAKTGFVSTGNPPQELAGSIIEIIKNCRAWYQLFHRESAFSVIVNRLRSQTLSEGDDYKSKLCTEFQARDQNTQLLIHFAIDIGLIGKQLDPQTSLDKNGLVLWITQCFSTDLDSDGLRSKLVIFFEYLQIKFNEENLVSLLQKLEVLNKIFITQTNEYYKTHQDFEHLIKLQKWQESKCENIITSCLEQIEKAELHTYKNFTRLLNSLKKITNPMQKITPDVLQNLNDLIIHIQKIQIITTSLSAFNLQDLKNFQDKLCMLKLADVIALTASINAFKELYPAWIGYMHYTKEGPRFINKSTFYAEEKSPPSSTDTSPCESPRSVLVEHPLDDPPAVPIHLRNHLKAALADIDCWKKRVELNTWYALWYGGKSMKVDGEKHVFPDGITITKRLIDNDRLSDEQIYLELEKDIYKRQASSKYIIFGLFQVRHDPTHYFYSAMSWLLTYRDELGRLAAEENRDYLGAVQTIQDKGNTPFPVVDKKNAKESDSLIRSSTQTSNSNYGAIRL